MRCRCCGVAPLGLLAGSTIGVAGQEDAAWPSTGCDKSLVEPGDYEDINDVGDDADKYWVVVPETYGDDGPVPLVLWLSSGDGSADANYAGWKPYLSDIEVLFADRRDRADPGCRHPAGAHRPARGRLLHRHAPRPRHGRVAEFMGRGPARLCRVRAHRLVPRRDGRLPRLRLRPGTPGTTHRHHRRRRPLQRRTVRGAVGRVERL